MFQILYNHKKNYLMSISTFSNANMHTGMYCVFPIIFKQETYTISDIKITKENSSKAPFTSKINGKLF